MAKTAEQIAAEKQAKADAAAAKAKAAADAKAAKAAAAAQKKADAAKVKSFQEAQKAETIALKASLKTQGLTTSAINKAVSAEKKANTDELKTVKADIKTNGYANVPTVSKAGTYTGQTAYDVSKTLTAAAGLYSQYGIQPITSAGGDGSYTGVSLANLTKATLNKDANGLFTQGTGDTKLPSSVYKTLTDATTNYGKTLTADQVGKVKSIGKDANGNDLYSKTLGGGDTAGYSLLKKNADGTYTNVGYTSTYTPPQDSGGFFSSTLGKIALAGGAILTGGALAPYIGATLGTGTIASGAIAGGLVGAGTAALTGGNIAQGIAFGAVGGAVGGAFKEAAGLSDAEFMAYDAKNLAAQGLSADQIASTLASSGYDPSLINAAVTSATTTGSTFSDISKSISDTYNQVTGTGTQNLTDNQWLGDQAKSLYASSGGDLNAVAQNLEAMGVDPFVAQDIAQQVGYGATPEQLTTYLNSAYGADSGLLSGANTLTKAGVQGMGTAVSGLESTMAGDVSGLTGGLPSGVTSGLTKAAAGALLGGAGGTGTGLLSSALGGAAGIYGANADKAALAEQANKITAAAAGAAPKMQFQPVGMTTRFGSTTTPQYDANGRLIGYGYTAAEDIAAQRDRLLGLSNQALPTTTDITQATADYYNQLQNLMNPQREQSLAGIKSSLQATGRGGLAYGATTGAGGANALAATNPELAAYYNALAQEQSKQALTAQDIAQQRLTNQIATSGTLFGQARDLEAAAQQPMTLGMQYGQQTTAAAQKAAQMEYDAAVEAARLQAAGELSKNAAIQKGIAGITPGIASSVGGLLSSGVNAATDWYNTNQGVNYGADLGALTGSGGFTGGDASQFANEWWM